MTTTPLLRNCQRRLALAWYTLSACVIGLIAVQIQTGVGDSASWTWLSPHIIPSLSLITGAVIAAETRADEQKRVSPFLFRLGMAFSILYLLAILAVIVGATNSHSRIDALKRSDLYLGPVQGIVVALLGVFYVSTHHHDAASQRVAADKDLDPLPNQHENEV